MDKTPKPHSNFPPLLCSISPEKEPNSNSFMLAEIWSKFHYITDPGSYIQSNTLNVQYSGKNTLKLLTYNRNLSGETDLVFTG